MDGRINVCLFVVCLFVSLFFQDIRKHCLLSNKMIIGNASKYAAVGG